MRSTIYLMSKKIILLLTAVFPTVFVSSLSAAHHGSGDGVNIIPKEDFLRIEINEELFTNYHFKGGSHVYFYPVLGPGGLPVTRNYPMKKVDGESHDHPHHQSLWYAHGDVNGIDFWAKTSNYGTIKHDRFLVIRSGKKSGLIRSANNWISKDGELICTDERNFRVYNRPNNERLFDYEITYKAGDEPLVLGDTKEGSMAIRVAGSMPSKPKHDTGGIPPGHIVQSTGLKDDDTWGKRAVWCDYYGYVDGKVVGMAIFDHPDNPRHPTWWHVRNYGLFAANPFGLHYFEGKPRGSGNLTIPAGESLTFKYRIFLHEGNEKQADVAGRYADYAAAKP